jgi:N-methylhydantoinase B
MASKVTGVKLAQGQRVRLETPGGGGWGDPASRAPAAVARDVRRGFIGSEAARTTYRVALDAAGEVDAPETARLRTEARP